ncbi:putative transcription factor C2H2 family [Helianthus debilis subsp. tardiflorus]
MSGEEEKKCPLCAEEMDWTDQQLNPCKCGYEVCVWCWHHIMDMAEKDATEGRCPACRTPYDKDRVVGLEANFQRVVGNSSSQKQKVLKGKSKTSESRKDLSNVRVIQRKMAYIIGLPLDLADEDLLQRKDYFGKYGKVTKVSLSRTAGGALQQFVNDTCSVYITYSKEEEAVTCIQSVHGYVLDGRPLKASFGTAKYCHAWLRNTPCNNPTCLYLHTIGAEEDSFGKDEAAAVHTRNRVQEIVGSTKYVHRRSGSTLPPPVVEQFNHNASAEDPVYDGMKDVGYAPIKPSKEATTFVDMVCSDSKHAEIERSDSVQYTSSNPNQFVDSPTFDDKKSKDSFKNYSDPWYDTENDNQISADHYVLNSYVDEEDNSNIQPSQYTDSTLNDGYNENKFQSLAKSDKIYRGANSFSNEEIVEHLRRLDHDAPLVDDDEDSAALESSIISNILSIDLDGDDSPYPQTVAGLLQPKDARSWNFQNNDQSIFSFANEHRFSGQQNDLSTSTIASRVQNSTPPGFSATIKPPPGFSSCMRAEQAVAAGSGNYMRTGPNALYGSPFLGNLYNINGDVGKLSTNFLNNSWSSSFDEDTKPWLFMQQQSVPQFSQPTMLQPQQHTTPQFPSQVDLYGGLTSGLADLHRQSYNSTPSLFTQQPKFEGGGFQQHNPLQEVQVVQVQQQGGTRGEVQKYGFDSLLSDYGDYMFQTPTSGDLYTPRVFGM